MKTGFFCEYNSGFEDNILAVRCDMDGLLVSEQSDKEYKSINSGVMHACGHDVHMTTVAGLAIMLKELKLNTFYFSTRRRTSPWRRNCNDRRGSNRGC